MKSSDIDETNDADDDDYGYCIHGISLDEECDECLEDD